jgi:hypothetical protein
MLSGTIGNLKLRAVDMIPLTPAARLFMAMCPCLFIESPEYPLSRTSPFLRKERRSSFQASARPSLIHGRESITKLLGCDLWWIGHTPNSALLTHKNADGLTFSNMEQPAMKSASLLSGKLYPLSLGNCVIAISISTLVEGGCASAVKNALSAPEKLSRSASN